MKALTLCLCLAFVGCAGTKPQDFLEYGSRWSAAALSFYHQACDGFEDKPECVAMRDAYNHSLDALAEVNDKAAK